MANQGLNNNVVKISENGTLIPTALTSAQMLALTPSEGEMCYCSTYGKWFFYNGSTWQVEGETIELTNKSGGSLATGKVVIIDSANNNSCDTVAGGFNLSVVGAIVIGGANNVQMTIAYSGIWDVDFNESVARGEWARTSADAGRGAGDAAAAAGMFAQVVEASGGAGLARCFLFTKEVY